MRRRNFIKGVVGSLCAMPVIDHIIPPKDGCEMQESQGWVDMWIDREWFHVKVNHCLNGKIGIVKLYADGFPAIIHQVPSHLKEGSLSLCIPVPFKALKAKELQATFDIEAKCNG